MKKIQGIMIAALALLCVALTGRSGGSAALFPRYTATFWADGRRILRVEVVLGDHAYAPQTDGQGRSVTRWLDEDGAFTDVSSCFITRDRVFTAWFAPEVQTRIGAYFPAADGLAQADKALSRSDAAALLCRLLALPGADGDPVAAVTQAKLMRGYPDGSFQPERAVTRAEFTAALAHILKPAQSGSVDFTDVPAGHWAADAIFAAAQAGWICGYDDGSFRPDAPLSRAEAACLVNRALFGGADENAVAAAYPASPLADITQSHWAYFDLVQATCRTAFLSRIFGEVGTPVAGFTRWRGALYHVNETLCYDHYEAGFHQIDGSLYHCSEDGYALDVLPPGIQWFDGVMYCVQEDGSFLTDGDFGVLHFGPDGRYTSGSEIIDAAVADILSTLDGSLHDAYNYVRQNTGYTFRGDSYDRGSHGWELACGETVFLSGRGHCYYWAAEFLYLARALGYQAKAVVGGAGGGNVLHCWVVVEQDGQWFICDPELEWTVANGHYDGKHHNWSMYMQPLDDTVMPYFFKQDDLP